MLILILGGLTIVVVGGLVLGRRAHKARHARALGTVSQAWVANHRSASYDTKS